MKIKITLVLSLFTFLYSFVSSNDVEHNLGNEINELNSLWSSGTKKQLLDTSYLDLLDAQEVEFQIAPNGETAFFNAVPGVPSMIGFFHGQSGGKSLNLYENPRTKAVVGSMVNSETNEILQITTNSIGQTEIITRHVDDFDDDGDEVSLDIPDSKKGFFGSRHLNQFDFPKLRSSSSNGSRSLSSAVVFDVMVVWTKTSECKNSGLNPWACELTEQTKENMLDKIQLAVDETNTAFALSGISSQIRLVHAYMDTTYSEISTSQALDDITGQQDGYMDDVHAKRAVYGADLVSLWIDTSSGCGLGWVGPHKDYMFSVTNWACATGYFSFGHELVHNIGCNHDRGSEDNCETPKPNFGYRDPKSAFRDIMSYNCKSGQCDNVAPISCPRVQRFSNTVSNYEGAPIGNVMNDCASHVNAYSDYVASYFPSKTEEELVMIRKADLETAPPVNVICKKKSENCNANSLCCSNRCKWRKCT